MVLDVKCYHNVHSLGDPLDIRSAKREQESPGTRSMSVSIARSAVGEAAPTTIAASRTYPIRAFTAEISSPTITSLRPSVVQASCLRIARAPRRCHESRFLRMAHLVLRLST
jgi:hypothetical protein